MSIDPIDPIMQFRDALARAGLPAPEHIAADGALHRFATNGRASDDSGWYVLHLDGVAAGAFGDWRSGLSETWRADIGRALTPQEERAHRQRMEQARRERERAETERAREAAQRAAELWRAAVPAPADHPYLARKGVEPHGLRVHRGALVIGGIDCDGALVLPLRDASGELQSLEFIAAGGEKRYLPGGRITGCYFAVGQPDGVLVIAEGYATAASVHAATGYATACATNAGNLLPVAQALRAKFPQARIIMAADHDENGTGERAAMEAARAVGGGVAMPADVGADWNDVLLVQGVAAVRAGIAAARPDELGRHSRPSSDTGAAVIRCLRDVLPVPVRWLWPERIAQGKVTLIAGDPGLGKSQVTAALAACVSVGGRWPVDRSVAPSGNIIILSAEDDPADTIRPRLDAAGADVSRVHVLDAVRVLSDDGRAMQRTFDLARDLEALQEAASRIGNVALIIIDPISAYLGGTDSHRNADVRGLLAPLGALASEIGAAIVVVSHLNKGNGSDALMRVTGSLAFVAAARAAYLVIRDAQDSARRLFVAAKNNLGPDQGNGLAFRIAPVTLDSGIATSRVEWEAEPVTLTANEALAAMASTDDEDRSARGEAQDFLREVLANGPVAAREIWKQAETAGIAKNTLKRAKAALGVVAEKAHFAGGWRWSLPPKRPKSDEEAQEAQSEKLGPFDEVGPLRSESEELI